MQARLDPCGDALHRSTLSPYRPFALMTAQRIYLDHHATTPVDPRAADVILRAMTEVFGNANSAEHAFGREAARWVDRAAAEVADLVGAQTEDVRFTSGASEALRLGLAYASERKGPGPLRVAASTIEHPALLSELERGVRKGWFEVSDLAVDDQGLVRFPAIEHRLAEGVDLICLMAANNEVGTLQPIEEAARLTQAAGSAILVDATQAAGRVTLSARASAIDYLILSGHKLYGPKGLAHWSARTYVWPRRPSDTPSISRLRTSPASRASARPAACRAPRWPLTRRASALCATAFKAACWRRSRVPSLTVRQIVDFLGTCTSLSVEWTTRRWSQEYPTAWLYRPEQHARRVRTPHPTSCAPWACRNGVSRVPYV